MFVDERLFGFWSGCYWTKKIVSILDWMFIRLFFFILYGLWFRPDVLICIVRRSLCVVIYDKVGLLYM